jgi:transmembrane sensor
VKDAASITDLIAKYLSGNIARKEKQKLFAWMENSEANQKFFDEMVHLWKVSADYEEEPFQADVSKAWVRVEKQLERGIPSRISGRKSAKIIPLSNSKRLLSIAAVLLFLLGIGWWWFSGKDAANSGQVIIAAGRGEKKELKLPDGSKVWLNENTKIAFQKDFEKRQLDLVGEAFFEVVKMEKKPFEIFCDASRITVLGTSFNVRNYPREDQVEVSVQRGIVALWKMNSFVPPTILEAGESGVFDKKYSKVQKARQQISNAASWKTQRLVFNDSPMPEVIKTLERHFDVTIKTANDNILNCTFTNIGAFKPADLNVIFEVFNFSMQLEAVRLENGTYLLKGEGCDKKY